MAEGHQTLTSLQAPTALLEALTRLQQRVTRPELTIADLPTIRRVLQELQEQRGI